MPDRFSLSSTPIPACATLFPYTTLFRSVSILLRRHVKKSAYAASYPIPRSTIPSATEIGRAHSELQSPYDLVCRLLLEKKKLNHYICLIRHIHDQRLSL